MYCVVSSAREILDNGLITPCLQLLFLVDFLLQHLFTRRHKLQPLIPPLRFLKQLLDINPALEGERLHIIEGTLGRMLVRRVGDKDALQKQPESTSGTYTTHTKDHDSWRCPYARHARMSMYLTDS